MNLIEIGLRKFHGLSVEERKISFTQKKYNENEAFLWRYPSGDAITYEKELKDVIIDKNLLLFDLHGNFDREYILERNKFKPFLNNEYGYKLLFSKDKYLMDDFLNECSDRDKMYGQVSIEDEIVVGIMDCEKLIAVSSIWMLENNLCDIGLIIHPNYRHQGLGKSIVSYIIDKLPEEKVPVYRADYDNISSVKIAESLGFSLFTKIFRIQNQNIIKQNYHL